MDLNNLQHQLRAAIQNHQALVAKRRLEPQNVMLPKQISDLQLEIKTLSDKQKQVVQQLRKELVTNKQVIVGYQCTPTTVINHIVQPAVQQTPAQVNSRIELTIPKPIPVSSNSVLVVNPPNVRTLADVAKTVVVTSSAFCKTGEATSVCMPLNLAPPIRVPQYPVQPAKPVTTQITLTTSTQPVLINSSVSKIVEVKKSTTKSSDSKKIDFMGALGLITINTLNEIQNKKPERKRRITANPQFSCGNWEHPDFLFPSVGKKRNASNLISSNTTGALPPGFKRPRGRPRNDSHTPVNSQPGTPDGGSPELNGSSQSDILNGLTIEKIIEDICVVCQNSATDLLTCKICKSSFHQACAKSSPDSSSEPWCCPKCQVRMPFSVFDVTGDNEPEDCIVLTTKKHVDCSDWWHTNTQPTTIS